jgi:nucleoside 2-deoxyribosyltransferase
MTILKPKVYVAGPMRWKPQFNIPAFDAAAAALRARGFDVVSPAELDDPALRAEELLSPDGNEANLTQPHEFGDLLARDLVIITTAGLDAIYVLPGWEQSSGTRLETYVGRALKGIPIRRYDTGREVPLTHLVRAWLGGEDYGTLITLAREAWANVR